MLRFLRMKIDQRQDLVGLALSFRIASRVTATVIALTMIAGYQGRAQTRTVPELNGDRFLNAANRSEYFIDEGLGRPVTALANSHLFGNNAWHTDNIGLSSIATGSILDDAYLARPDGGTYQSTVFLMDHLPDGWHKRPITGMGFNTCGFNISLVEKVQQSVIDQALPGDTIDYQPHALLRIAPELNGGRYMDTANGTVYFIDDGLRRPITGPGYVHLFGNQFWRSDNVGLNLILAGDLLTDDAYLARPDGGTYQSTVFLMDLLPDGWHKRPITGMGFNGSGFDASKIGVVSQAVFNQATLGDTINFKGPPTPQTPQQPSQPVQPPGAGGGGNIPISDQHCTITVPEPSIPITCNQGLTVQAPCHSCKTAETGAVCSGIRCESSVAVCGASIPVSQSCPN